MNALNSVINDRQDLKDILDPLVTGLNVYFRLKRGAMEKSEPVRGLEIGWEKRRDSAFVIIGKKGLFFWLEFMSQLLLEFTVRSWIWNVSHPVNGKCISDAHKCRL